MKRTSILIFFFFLGCVKTEIEPTEKLPINFIGDSMTAGFSESSYPGQLLPLFPNRTLSNIGIGGQNAQQIAARQGSLPIYVSLSGNSFQGDKEVPLDAINSEINGTKFSNLILSTPATNVEKTIKGSINGIKCTIIRRTRGELVPPFLEFYYIKPATPIKTDIAPNSLFIPDEGLHQDSCISIIWIGRNNDLSTIEKRQLLLDIIDKSISFNKSNKFLILGILKQLSSVNGTNPSINDDLMSNMIRNKYPNNYIEVSPPSDIEMKDINFIPTFTDKLDISNGVFPTGMRQDNTHLIKSGNAIIANRVYKKLKELNY